MFVKGQSGNPAGRPKKTKEAIEFERLCNKHLILAFEIVRKACLSDDLEAQKWGAEKLMERSLGKPLQRTENDNYNHDETRLSDAEILAKLKELQAQNVDPGAIRPSPESSGDSGIQATA